MNETLQSWQLRHARAGQRPARSYAASLLDDFFTPRSQLSFRECYVEITGDARVTGLLEHCDQTRMREAIDTGTWTEALGDAIRRRMVKEYRDDPLFDAWRKLSRLSERPITDFRTQERTRYGGYGDLPIVGEGASYLALPSPAEEKVTYALTKRGGTETVTLEAVKNDDVRAIRLIPKRLAQAANRTLLHFVLDFLRTNPAIYDGVALFHVDHNNLGSDALSTVSLGAARSAIRKQAKFGDDGRLHVEPRYLWVPLDLEETAVNLFRRGTNNDRTFMQTREIEVIPVADWLDANDWCLSADPEDCPTIEIGFLDGEDEPQLFVQDEPTSGSVFSNDQTTFKIRHIYGGAVMDYRGLYKSVVL